MRGRTAHRLAGRLILLALAVAFVISAYGCQGGGDELEAAFASLSENDLAIMVLPLEELDEDFSDFRVAGGSGFIDNVEAADDTLDPADDAVDLEEAGRLGGYELEYEDSSLAALEDGEGTISVVTEIGLFEDSDLAEAFLAVQLADMERLEGRALELGLTLLAHDLSSAEGLGDHGSILFGEFRIGEVIFYQTTATFSLDRLVGAATIYRSDGADVRLEAEAMGKALEQRIRDVLVGDVAGRPVSLPQGDVDPKAERPEGVPDLTRVALSLDDLPAGVSVRSEGYVANDDTIASYERNFDLGVAKVGSSTLTFLETDVDLFSSPGEANLSLLGIETAFSGESSAQFWEAGLGEELGLKPDDVQTETFEIVGLANEHFVTRVSFTTPPGRLERYLVFILARSARSSLTAQGFSGDIAQADVEELARALEARMEAGLTSAVD